MNILDIVFAIVAGFFIIRGIFRGLIVEVVSLVGAAAGFFLANKYHPELIPYIQKVTGASVWVGALAYLAVFIGTIVFASVLAGLVSRALPSVAAALNYLAGGVLGALKGGLICLVAFMVLHAYMPDAAFLKQAKSYPYLMQAAEHFRQFMPEKIGKIKLTSLPPLTKAQTS